MNKMIQGLLEYSRATHDDVTDAITDANKALNAALEGLQQRITTSEAVVTADPLPLVPIHDSMLMRLFQNLIGNALKYAGDKPPRIHVSVRKTEGSWVFSVRDNGIGMEMRHTEQIFHLFRRLHADGDYEGAGVGLAICKRIVERQGGKIWVESELGKGSTFYFSIPAAKPVEILKPG
ncbi:MAG: GHKL domain-containing protein [Acidobacteriaceae bacterium]|nr:GHKL domain-containing protein [Acidobacteriaceae bacterium]